MRIAAVLTVLATFGLLSACDNRSVVSPTSDSDVRAPRSPHSNYMTEAEWDSAGSPTADGSMSSTTSEWWNSGTQFRGRGYLFIMGNVNEYSADLTATVKTTSGTTIDQTVEPLFESSMGPVHGLVPNFTTVFFSVASTGNKTCGLIGKAGITGYATLLVQIPQGPIVAKGKVGIGSNAAPLTLPECPKAKMKLAGGGDESSSYIEFRGPGSVTLSNTSEVVGSYSCEWLVDGGSTSNSCSSVVLSSPDTGSHSVKLTVTDGDANSSVVWGDFYIAPSCSTTGDSLTTLRASQSRSEFVLGTMASTITPCGSQTTPPGSGGGQPSEPPGGGENCHWVRDFKYWPDGSWEWLTPWYNSCDGEVMRAAIQTIDFVAPAPARARVFGTGPLRSGRHVLIERDSSSQYAVSISVDTTAAGPLDIAEALQVASRLARLPAPKGKTAFGAAIPDVFLRRKNDYSTEYVKANSTLRDLKRAPEALSKRDGRTRYIDIQLGR